MRNKTRLLSFIISLILLGAALGGCGETEEESVYVPLTEEDETVYRIGIADSQNTAYGKTIAQGFMDAVSDLMGDNHLEIVTCPVAGRTADELAAELTDNGCQLVFANGEEALRAAAISTDTIPVVAAGVADYQQALHIYSAGEWNRRTHANITGVSTVPSAALWVSLLIETAPQPEAVGLIYSPEDPLSIYENEQLEILLEEAGIPWKEYPVTHAQFSEVLEIPSSPNAILPSSQSMASIKDGPNTDVTFLGEDGLLSVLNADTGMRVPKISAFWPKEETLPAEQTATTETVVSAEGPGQTSETFSSETAETSLSISSEPRTVEDVITEACAECDILFLPSGVILSDDVETITRLATEAGVPTVSADPSDGAYALTTLYVDPYNMGYQAGKLAYRVLVNGDDAGGIRIASPTDKATVKLYQDSVAQTLGRTFPKSFFEYDTWLSEYETGMFTNRVEEEAD